MSDRRITNTSTDPATPYLVLLDGLDGNGGARAIEQMEKRGQQQLVNSDRLPTKGSDHPDFTALGFTFGEPDPADPIFRPATLPEGWRREASDHDMWSYLVDELGRRRVAIFYKAAFYDRSAFMRLESTESYCRQALWDDFVPTVDDTWLTRDRAVAEIQAIRADCLLRAAKYDGLGATDNADYWREEASSQREDAAKAQRMIERLTAEAAHAP